MIQGARADSCIGEDWQSIVYNVKTEAYLYDCAKNYVDGFPGDWNCWTNDHNRLVLKFPNVPELTHGKISFYGLFSGTNQDHEDVKVTVNGDSSSWWDPDTSAWTGWKWFTMPGTFTFQPGDNYIDIKHPWFDTEMADGKDGQYGGHSIHYGYIKIHDCYGEGECVPGETEICGQQECLGIRTCLQDATWSDCSSEESDCGVCCVCDQDGFPMYDETQDSDCPATECSDGCQIDSNPFTWDFANDVDNLCSGLYACTQNACDYQHECRDNDPDDGINGNACGAECDQDSDCNDTCSGDTRYYDGECSPGCECGYQAEDCNFYDDTYEGYHCYPAAGDIYHYYQDWTCSGGDCVNTGEEWRDGLYIDCRQMCSDTDGGMNYFSFGTVEYEDLCDSEGQVDCPSGSESDYCTDTVLTEYYCLGKDMVTTDKNCSDYDCTTPSQYVCEGAGTSVLREKGDMYSCDQGECGVAGTTTCDGPWVCNEEYLCQRIRCGDQYYECYLSNSEGWLWGTPESTETNCGDWYDNDCDGLVDCNDPDCRGLSGPDGTLCCFYNSDCNQNDLPAVGECDFSPDGYHPTWDYHSALNSECAEHICTEPHYDSFTHTCNDDDMEDGVAYGSGCDALCDQDSDCGQPTELCNYIEKKHCTRDEFGECNSYFCMCVFDDWECGPSGDEDYCSECSHCGDGELNCQEECEDSEGCESFCEGDVRYFGGVCEMGCTCSFQSEDCTGNDGWYDSGGWTDYDCERCKDQEYRSYGCSPAECTYEVTDTRQVCENTNQGEVCDTGPYECYDDCTTGMEEYICHQGECVFHRWVEKSSCSPYSCLEGSCNGCSMYCGAECVSDTDCGPTECDQLDDCYGGTYRDYHDVENTCDSSCSCSENQCGNYDEIITDNDGDGYDTECDGDCDDTDGSIHPGAEELCNGVDDDCDGIIDEGCECTPGDTRSCGYDGCQGTQSCNSTGQWDGPCSSEGSDCGVCCICDSNGIENYDESQDSDCLPVMCPDDACGADCCGAHIWGSYPEYVENECMAKFLCTDNDCDDYVTCEEDLDGDGYSPNCGDCNDSDPDVHPGAPEICNGIDDDCDGTVDEGCECNPGETESCGSGQCEGIRTCVEPGYWGDCSTGGQDCGICCICDEDGNELYDGTQNSDCPATVCAESCNIDSNPFTWDFASDVENYCTGLDECSSNPCIYEHVCSDNDSTDGINGNTCGAECDQDSDCTDTCHFHVRYYNGDCDTTISCECSYDWEDCNDYDCSTPQPFECEGIGTDEISETGDDYYCGQGSCFVNNTKVCNGPWECDQSKECVGQECGDSVHTCYFDGGFLWGTPPGTEDNCTDGRDNDCDGLIDCEDPDCLGEEGPNGYLCCQIDGDCDDGNECTDDSCTEEFECLNEDDDTNECSDGLYCTINDRCSEGFCIGDPKVCDDGNECTSGECIEQLEGECVYTNLPDQMECGQPRDCPDDICILLNWTDYPEDGHDYCMAGECREYSCEVLSSSYDERCEPPCYEWTYFADGDVSKLIQYPQGGGYDSSGKVNMPTNIDITHARVDITGIPVTYSSDKEIDVTVVNDVSGSMNDNCGPDGIAQPGETPCKINDMKYATKELIDVALNNSPNKVGLVSYTTWVQDFMNLSDDAQALKDNADTYEALYKTCISCGIEKGIEIINGGSNPTKVILLMTDGIANRCTYGSCTPIEAREEAIAKATEAWNLHGIMVYAVAFGADADKDTMQDIADVGNGEYYYAEDSDLADFYVSIITKLMETPPTNPHLDVGANGVIEWSFPGEFIGTETAHFVDDLNYVTHRCESNPCPGCDHNSTSGNCTVDLRMFSETTGEIELTNLYIYGCECLGGTCPVDQELGTEGDFSTSGSGGTTTSSGGSLGTFSSPAPAEPEEEEQEDVEVKGPVYKDNVLTLSGCLREGTGTVDLYVGKDKVHSVEIDENGCFSIEYSAELPKGMNKITLWNEENKVMETYVPSYSAREDTTRRGSARVEEIEESGKDSPATGFAPAAASAAVATIAMVSLGLVLLSRKGKKKR